MLLLYEWLFYTGSTDQLLTASPLLFNTCFAGILHFHYTRHTSSRSSSWSRCRWRGVPTLGECVRRRPLMIFWWSLLKNIFNHLQPWSRFNNIPCVDLHIISNLILFKLGYARFAQLSDANCCKLVSDMYMMGCWHSDGIFNYHLRTDINFQKSAIEKNSNPILNSFFSFPHTHPLAFKLSFFCLP